MKSKLFFIIIGGLFTTLLLTPFIIPPLYYMLGRKKWRKMQEENTLETESKESKIGHEL